MIYNERVLFNNPIKINAGVERNSQKFVRNDTTPSVLNHDFWICNNIAPTSVTKFVNGQDCQSINLLGDGFTTVVNGANIKTSTGANKLLAANKVYRFTMFNNIWYEDA